MNHPLRERHSIVVIPILAAVLACILMAAISMWLLTEGNWTLAIPVTPHEAVPLPSDTGTAGA